MKFLNKLSVMMRKTATKETLVTEPQKTEEKDSEPGLDEEMLSSSQITGAQNGEEGMQELFNVPEDEKTEDSKEEAKEETDKEIKDITEKKEE